MLYQNVYNRIALSQTCSYSLYYIQRDYLQRSNGTPAFSDEIQAWQFGPVVPDVYYAFCGFGAMPITMAYPMNEIEQEDRKRFDAIIARKARLNPWDMVNDTHKRGVAWDQVYRDGFGRKCYIPLALIQK